MLGAVMYVSTLIMSMLPNIHLLGLLVCSVTIAFRKKAIWPIFVFIMMTGLFNGFATWWIPYLYIWPILWLAVLLIPEGSSPITYMIVCSMHGFLYGTLYAPFQALLYGYDFKATVAWIIAGLPFDAIHGVSNFICGVLIKPVSDVLIKLKERL